MNTQNLIKATKRSETGKNENNRLRAKGRVPINLVSNGESIMASVDALELEKLVNSGIRYSTLIDIELDGTKSQVIVKEVQRFPATNRIRHVDFYKVQPGKKVQTIVGILTTGVAKGSKTGGQFEHIIHELKIRSTPEDMKDTITLDVTNLEIGQSIKVKELPVPKGWDILIEGDQIVTSVNKTKAILAAERTEKTTEKEAAKPGAAKPAAAGAGAAKPAPAAQAGAPKKK